MFVTAWFETVETPRAARATRRDHVMKEFREGVTKALRKSRNQTRLANPPKIVGISMGKPSNNKGSIKSRFLVGTRTTLVAVQVLIATDVISRGIDVPQVRPAGVRTWTFEILQIHWWLLCYRSLTPVDLTHPKWQLHPLCYRQPRKWMPRVTFWSIGPLVRCRWHWWWTMSCHASGIKSTWSGWGWAKRSKRGDLFAER